MGNKALQSKKSKNILYVFLKKNLIVHTLLEKKCENSNFNRIYTFIIPDEINSLILDTDVEIKFYDNINNYEITCCLPSNFKNLDIPVNNNKIFDKCYTDYILSNFQVSSHNHIKSEIILRCDKKNLKPSYIIVNYN